MKLKKIIFLIIIIIIFLGLFKFFSFSQTDAKLAINDLLKNADIEINGARPWDIKVHDDNLFQRVLSQGSLGLGEAYMDGWWDCDALDQFFYKILSSELEKKVENDWSIFINALKANLINLQSKNRSFEVAEKHYDLDNDLFGKMLDRRMIYSCAYWKDRNNLEDAQTNKLDLICKKLNLKPGMKIVDIGCGWGGFANYAASKYGVEVVGITVSKEQAKLAQENCKNLPVKILIQDYRDLTGKFDRVVSVGMFEHVGYKNYKEFMKVVNSCLKDDGLFLLHTIGSNNTNYYADQWINKYIFPNSLLPSISQIGQAIEDFFVMEDWHNFGPNYDKTLMEWFARFQNSWDKIKDKYDERFYRMWKYYLLSCAALFRARNAQLWQIVLSKKGKINSYQSIR